MKWFLKFINNPLEILFPSHCFGCGKKNEIICPYCLSVAPKAEKEIANSKIFAIFDYQYPLMKKLIWQLKYHKHSYLGLKLGQIIYDEFLEELSNMKIYSAGEPILIIPVPISKKRNKARGYNQAEKIAQGFCLNSNRKILKLDNKIIYKKFETTPQARISNRTRRLKNIKDVFEIKDHEKVKNKTIIVIDDVTTTGGTIGEIIKILEKSGAKKVIGLAVAH